LPIYALRTLGLMLLLAPAALLHSPGNRTYIGQDIFVGAGQQVHNATCLFCSVQVEGELSGHAVVLFGNLNVSGQVRRSATVIGGNAVVDAQARINGDTAVLGGNAVYETEDSLSGSVYVLGGHLSRTGSHAYSHRRMSLNPFSFYSLAVLGFLLLSLLVTPPVRRYLAGDHIS
jgi:carbonic anhydrase/acetyltransferase-like protein (isoleucine patch superfamily)